MLSSWGLHNPMMRTSSFHALYMPDAMHHITNGTNHNAVKNRFRQIANSEMPKSKIDHKMKIKRQKYKNP